MCCEEEKGGGHIGTLFTMLRLESIIAINVSCFVSQFFIMDEWMGIVGCGMDDDE